MGSVDTCLAVYLAHLPAPITTFGSSSTPHYLSTAFGSRQRSLQNPTECSSCGIPLKLFRKCCRLTGSNEMTAHLCITTYRSHDNEVLKLELCFVGQDCQRIPSILGATYGQQTKRLDLSYNAIRSLEGLEKFPYLEELVLDNNYIDDGVAVPRIETLHTLSLNKNKLTNLEKFLDQISERLPNLRYLSLLGNEACPDQLTASEDDEKDYKRYRLYVLHRVPSLRFLDSSSVRRSEMREARKRGGLSKTVKLATVPAQKPGGKDADNHTTGPVENAVRNGRSNSDTTTTVANGTTTPKLGSPDPKHQGSYGARQYKYIGQHSEGNRFIKDHHL